VFGSDPLRSDVVRRVMGPICSDAVIITCKVIPCKKVKFCTLIASNNRLRGGERDDNAHGSHSRICASAFRLRLDLHHASRRRERV